MSGRRTILLTVAAVLLAGCSRNDGRTLTPPRTDQTLSIVTTTVAKTASASVDGAGDGSIDNSGGGGSVDASDDPEAGDPPTLLAPWVAGDPIPTQYTCKGADHAPSLVWRGIQAGAVEQVIVMTDVDANDFVQWMVVGIPPTINNLDPANLPRGARVSQNSAGTSDYKGPCPTSGRHTYFITLYALRTESRITFSTPAAEALATINAAQTENVSVSGSVDS